ncbi:MAG: T9SS type A sorting domain-containing protein [Cryomorphaceae bacterium]|nr:T9SS type A sorting domain-containing protein [Cryomorphaceae bacterium]
MSFIYRFVKGFKSAWFLTLCTLLLPSIFIAQQVISSQGESYSNTNTKIDFTMGEMVTNTASDGTIDLTQGFHQTNWIFVGVEDLQPETQVNIYPNPSVDELTIETSAFKELSFEIVDAVGKLVEHDELSAKKTPVKVARLAPGNYTLNIRHGGQVWKTFKLIKSH